MNDGLVLSARKDDQRALELVVDRRAETREWEAPGLEVPPQPNKGCAVEEFRLAKGSSNRPAWDSDRSAEAATFHTKKAGNAFAFPASNAQETVVKPSSTGSLTGTP